MTTTTQRAIRYSIGLAGFCLWGYLLIDGRSLAPTTTLAFLFLILACIGLGSLIGDIAAFLGGGRGGSGGSGGDDNG